MQQQAEFWRHCIHTLKRKQNLALLLVVDSQGSSPGKAGAKMAITADGTRFGTIGGGQVEYDLSEQALALIQQDSCSRLFCVQHDGSGQVCGGKQTVLYYPCSLIDLTILQDIENAFQQKQVRQLVFTAEGMAVNETVTEVAKICFSDSADTGWVYQELIGIQKTAYIIGGGHVGLALSQVLSLLDFDILVIDQRPALKTMEDNHYARQKIIIPYAEIRQHIEAGKQCYVFIMTYSHQTDQQVLAGLIDRQYAYIGVLGSKRKIRLLQQNLADTISKQCWQPIHAPMGLTINSQTPMEIAISIGAELIKEINAIEKKS